MDAHRESLYFYIYPPAWQLVLQETHLQEMCSHIPSDNSNDGSSNRIERIEKMYFSFQEVESKHPIPKHTVSS